MSFVTGTAVELLYASTTATAALAVTTIATINPGSSAMGVQAHIPPDFWLPNSAQVGRGLRIVARGILSTTTTTPSYTWGIALGASAATAPIVAGSAALAMTASCTNIFWELDAEVIMVTMGAAGAHSTIVGTGSVTCGGFSATAASGGALQPVFGGAASPGTVATVDTSIPNYININLTSTAANTSNTVTLQQLLVWGLN